MHLTPLYEKIVIILDDKQEITSKSGLQYTQNMSLSANTINKGRVVAVGEGRLLSDGNIIPLKVKVDDKVLFSKIHGESYNDGTNNYIILSESNILAIIKEDIN